MSTASQRRDDDFDPDPPDGPLFVAPPGIASFEWALHLSEALCGVCDQVASWQQVAGVARLPTLAELEAPPFNLRTEFAWRFLAWASRPEEGPADEGGRE